MAEDVKKPASPPSPKGEDKPTTEKAGALAPETELRSGAAAANPAASVAAAPKPPAGAAGAAKPTAPAKPAGPVPIPWSSPMVEKYKRQYGSGVEALTYLGQNYFSIDRSLIPDFLRLMRNEEDFDYCVDITAVHYPKRERQFDVVWILYSFPCNERIRVKTQIKDDESIASAVSIWSTADWLEREVFDMFGIEFEGHPNLKRILLPDGWQGHPLRKDYDILQQDKQWVQINLGIESGQ